jgi:hypothetical protein
MGPDARDATYLDNGFTAYDAGDLVMRTGAAYVDPQLSFRAPIGITALAFLHSKRFPLDLRDELLFGDTNHGDLYLARMAPGRDALALDGSLADKVADSGAQRQRLVLGEGFSVITDLQVGPDGYVYVVDFLAGAIHRLRPLFDTVEPAELEFLPWGLVEGGAEDLDVSDDVSLHVIEAARGRRSPPFAVHARFQLNAADPTALRIVLEDRAAESGSWQEIRARNVVTGAFDLVDAARLDDVDATRTVSLAVPKAYVDPATFVLELRIEISPPGARVGLAPRPPVECWIDLLQILATYP